MAVNKFEKYVMKGKPGLKPDADNPGVVTAVLEGPQGWSGISPRITWKYVSQPAVMKEEPHSHDFEEWMIFLPNNASEPQDFNAEIEISFGEEGETHKIDTSAVVFIPKGLAHSGVTFKKVGKPVMYATIYLAPDYISKPVSMKTQSAGGTKYGKYVLRKPVGDPRPLPTEKWGVHVSEKTCSGLGEYNANFNFLSILGGHMLPDPPHDHTCDEMLFLVPASFENWPELGGEVYIGLGENWEPQIITTAAVLAVPKGVAHCPVFMKKVDKPFYWGHMIPVSSYQSSEFDPDAKVAP